MAEKLRINTARRQEKTLTGHKKKRQVLIRGLKALVKSAEMRELKVLKTYGWLPYAGAWNDRNWDARKLILAVEDELKKAEKEESRVVKEIKYLTSPPKSRSRNTGKPF
jgi:hypothetical protein